MYHICTYVHIRVSWVAGFLTKTKGNFRVIIYFRCITYLLDKTFRRTNLSCPDFRNMKLHNRPFVYSFTNLYVLKLFKAFFYNMYEYYNKTMASRFIDMTYHSSFDQCNVGNVGHTCTLAVKMFGPG